MCTPRHVAELRYRWVYSADVLVSPSEQSLPFSKGQLRHMMKHQETLGPSHAPLVALGRLILGDRFVHKKGASNSLAAGATKSQDATMYNQQMRGSMLLLWACALLLLIGTADAQCGACGIGGGPAELNPSEVRRMHAHRAHRPHTNSFTLHILPQCVSDASSMSILCQGFGDISPANNFCMRRWVHAWAHQTAHAARLYMSTHQPCNKWHH